MTDQNTSPPVVKKDQAIRDQVALLSFVEDLLREQKDPNVKPENLPKLKEVLLKEVNDSINRHLISLLTDGNQIELEGLLDKNVSDEELDNFFVKKIPNLEAEIASVLLNFRAAYLLPTLGQDVQPKSIPQSATPAPKPSFPPPAPIPVDKMN